MPRLEDLRKSLTEMSDDELRSLHGRIREDRKLRKDTGKTRKAKVQQGVKVRDKLSALFEGLSEEQRAELLAQLEA